MHVNEKPTGSDQAAYVNYSCLGTRTTHFMLSSLTKFAYTLRIHFSLVLHKRTQCHTTSPRLELVEEVKKGCTVRKANTMLSVCLRLEVSI